jgi:hypothetical protein
MKTAPEKYAPPRQAFDAAAALALLGYRPPPPPPPPKTKPRSAKAAAAAAEEAAAASPDLVAALLRRSARAQRHFSPRDTANAVFVLSRMGEAGSVDAEWLRSFCEVGPGPRGRGVGPGPRGRGKGRGRAGAWETRPAAQSPRNRRKRPSQTPRTAQPFHHVPPPPQKTSPTPNE